MTSGDSEHDDQVRIFAWAASSLGAYPELGLLYAIPNGAKLPWKKDYAGRRYSPEAKRLKSEGLRSGVPDMCLPVARGCYHGLYVELKHGDNRPSLEQLAWINALRGNGYQAEIVWGWEKAVEAIENYLGGRK